MELWPIKEAVSGTSAAYELSRDGWIPDEKWIIGTRMPCDRHAVRELFARLAALGCAAISVHQIEINPLIAGDERAGAAAVDALVAMVQQ